MGTKNLSKDECEELLGTLKNRFEKNMNRHKNLEWPNIQAEVGAARTQRRPVG